MFDNNLETVVCYCKRYSCPMTSCQSGKAMSGCLQDFCHPTVTSSRSGTTGVGKVYLHTQFASRPIRLLRPSVSSNRRSIWNLRDKDPCASRPCVGPCWSSPSSSPWAHQLASSQSLQVMEPPEMNIATNFLPWAIRMIRSSIDFPCETVMASNSKRPPSTYYRKRWTAAIWQHNRSSVVISRGSFRRMNTSGSFSFKAPNCGCGCHLNIQHR